MSTSPTPIVSVIINSQNTKALPTLAIQEVMNSTYTPYEIIVVENGVALFWRFFLYSFA